MSSRYDSLRDDAWLRVLLDYIWDNHFSDVPQMNDVRIEFGRRAKRRLGSISLCRENHNVSVITINSIFRLPEVPEAIVRSTIVHELIHYTHGFNSPLEQKYNHPHAGGIIRREYVNRGLHEMYVFQKKWLKENWALIIERELPKADSRRARAVVSRKRFSWL